MLKGSDRIGQAPRQHQGVAQQGLFLAGFLLACVAWAIGCASLIALTRRRLPPLAWRLLNAGCGVGLLCYALVLARRLTDAV